MLAAGICSNGTWVPIWQLSAGLFSALSGFVGGAEFLFQLHLTGCEDKGCSLKPIAYSLRFVRDLERKRCPPGGSQYSTIISSREYGNQNRSVVEIRAFRHTEFSAFHHFRLLAFEYRGGVGVSRKRECVVQPECTDLRHARHGSGSDF